MASADASSSNSPTTQGRERKRRSSNSHQYCSWAENAVAGDSTSAPPTPFASPMVESWHDPREAAATPMVFLDRYGNPLGPTGLWIEVERLSSAKAEDGARAESAETAPSDLQSFPVVNGVPSIPPEMVLLHVYDIGEEGAGAVELLHTLNEMSTVNNSVFIGGIFHAGVEIYGREWAYGGNQDGSGVYESQPRADSKHTYRATVIMGLTALGQGEIEDMLERLVIDWPGNEYHLVHHNCLSFCSALCQEVGVGAVPSWIDRAPRTAAYIDNALQVAEDTLQETGVPDAIDDAQALMSEAILQAVSPAFEKVAEHSPFQSDALGDAPLIASEAVFQAAEGVRRCSVSAATVVGQGTMRAAEVVQEKSLVAGEALCVATETVLDEVGFDSEAVEDMQEVATEVAQQVADGVCRRSSKLLDAWEDVLVNVGVRSVIDLHLKPTAKQVFEDAVLAIEEVPRVYEESTVVEDASQAINAAGTVIEEVVTAGLDVMNETGTSDAIRSVGSFTGEVLSDAVDVVADLHPQWSKCSQEAMSGANDVAGAFRDVAGGAVSSAASAVRRGSRMLVGETLLVAEDAPVALASAVDAIRRVSVTVLSVVPASTSSEEPSRSQHAQARPRSATVPAGMRPAPEFVKCAMLIPSAHTTSEPVHAEGAASLASKSFASCEAVAATAAAAAAEATCEPGLASANDKASSSKGDISSQQVHDDVKQTASAATLPRLGEAVLRPSAFAVDVTLGGDAGTMAAPDESTVSVSDATTSKGAEHDTSTSTITGGGLYISSNNDDTDVDVLSEADERHEYFAPAAASVDTTSTAEAASAEEPRPSQVSPTFEMLLAALPFTWPTEMELQKMEKRKKRKRKMKHRQRQQARDVEETASAAIAVSSLSKGSTPVREEAETNLEVSDYAKGADQPAIGVALEKRSAPVSNGSPQICTAEAWALDENCEEDVPMPVFRGGTRGK